MKVFLLYAKTLLLTSLCIILHSSYYTLDFNNGEKNKFNKILHSTGIILKEAHYSPRKIDDTFSKLVFNSFIQKLDPEKNIFLESDIANLKWFETTIDNEILGDSISFFYEVMDCYNKRIRTLQHNYKEWLSKPLDFGENEFLEIDYNKMRFPENEINQKLIWRKKLKLLVMQRAINLVEKRYPNGIDSMNAYLNSEIEKEARLQVEKVIERFFNRLLQPQAFHQQFSLFINSITNLMDPHTDYFMPLEKRAMDEDLSGRFYGIGALIGETNGQISIASVSIGGPAWKTGLVSDGDIVVKVTQQNGEPVDVAGFDIEDAVKLIRGKKGTKVILTLKKIDGLISDVEIEREEIKLTATFAKSSILVRNSKKIGYIYLPKFYTDFDGNDGASCSKDVAKEVEKLKKEKIDGLIVDLRDNGGGSLYEVVQMVGLFIPSGPVVQVKSNGRTPLVINDTNKLVLYSGPLEVMVNEFSASASEIFAAAIQDYKRGIVIGSSSTFGKGTVQRPIALNIVDNSKDDIGAIHLTMQKYYRINGSSTQLRGVTPDIILPGYYSFFETMEKDNNNALPWDEISATNYTIWKPKDNLLLHIGSNKSNMAKETVFQKIEQNAIKLAALNRDSINLQLNLFVDNLKKRRILIAETRSLFKLKNKIEVRSVNDKIAGVDKVKVEEEKNWFSSLQQDIYLDAAVGLISKANLL